MAGLMRSWTDLELYTSCNILATNRLIEAARRAGVRAFRARIDVVGLRHRSRRRRGRSRSSRLAVRHHEARRREARARPRRARTGSPARSSGTSRSTGRASGRTWRTTSSPRRCSTGARSPSSATASRRARTRTSTTPSRARPRARARRGGRHLQHRWREDDLAQRGDRADRRPRRGRTRSSSASRPDRATSATRARTSHGRARRSGTSRRWSPPRACAPGRLAPRQARERRDRA